MKLDGRRELKLKLESALVEGARALTKRRVKMHGAVNRFGYFRSEPPLGRAAPDNKAAPRRAHRDLLFIFIIS